MSERPILFSAPMVTAILADSKTQTRRVVKDLVGGATYQGIEPDGMHLFTKSHVYGKVHCPYGKPGDRLWVRESCWIWGQWLPNGTNKRGKLRWRFEAIGQRVRFDRPDREEIAHWGDGPGWSLRPSIHMPRWASRILLEITEVRVERLQAISEADAQAEGVECDSDGWRDYLMPSTQCCSTARASFLSLWDSINGAGAADKNEWCWCISFKRVTP